MFFWLTGIHVAVDVGPLTRAEELQHKQPGGLQGTVYTIMSLKIVFLKGLFTRKQMFVLLSTLT